MRHCNSFQMVTNVINMFCLKINLYMERKMCLSMIVEHGLEAV